MSDNIKRMDITEFRKGGYLQEVNRQFLHPLGMALEIVVEDDRTEHFGDIWDYRDVPEGIRYGPGLIDPVKAAKIFNEFEKMAQTRRRFLGYVIQPYSDKGL